MYVDVHTHLTHSDFDADVEAVIERAVAAGLGSIVVNGTDPVANRKTLALAALYSVVKPALGIYPIDAVHAQLPSDFPHPVAPFDLNAEIAFIRSQAQLGRLAAVGECGLDAYWLAPSTFEAQEQVFRQLITVAIDTDTPVIVHTRKMEARAADILREMGARKVNFHCFGGKVKLAQQCAEKDGWWFSIPANAVVNEGFRKMLATLPPERILTETDAPYLGPERGKRNEPANVVGTVALLAQVRQWPVERAKEQVWSNYQALFGSRWT